MTKQPSVSRRDFCALAGGTVTSVMFGGACRYILAGMPNDGRLSARPLVASKTSITGRIPLERDGVLHIPETNIDAPLPLLVMLHGATQRAEDMFWYLGSTIDNAGVVILAPNSQLTTWDAISRGTFAEDVDYLNRTLERAFKTTAFDPERIAIGGFSDGATYALSLGLINGDLFRSIVAFSPGFVISGDTQGRPRIFISHGTNDHILPIDSCGRRIASNLKAQGYDVTFREFDGDHEIPPDVAREGLSFISKERSSSK